MSGPNRRVGVVAPDPSGLSGRVRRAGGEPAPVSIPDYPDGWGVALAREWISDRLEIGLAALDLDALVFEANSPAELAGIVVAAVRLRLPAVVTPAPATPFAAALGALGLSSFGEDAASVALKVASEGGPDVYELADGFSLANALRAGFALGGGPEVLVHLSAIAEESAVVGFASTSRVLVPEIKPLAGGPRSAWFERHGLAGLLGYLGEDLHDTRTVAGALKSHAPEGLEEPPQDAGFGYAFIEARSSGAEALCRVPGGVKEFSASCLTFDSEPEAVETLSGRLAGEDPAEENAIVVVRGCGPQGAPGMRVLEDLARTLKKERLESTVAVLTDGLAPEVAGGVWASAFSPEGAAGGIISRLADGDRLKLDFAEGRVLTAVDRREISRRPQARPEAVESPAYAVRYSQQASPSLDGATFG